MQFLLPFLNFTSQCILYIIPSINTLCSQKSICNSNFFLFIFWPEYIAFRILVSQPVIELMCLAVEVWSLNHWISR